MTFGTLFASAPELAVNFAGTGFWNQLTQSGHSAFGVICIVVALLAMWRRSLFAVIGGLILLGLGSLAVFSPTTITDIGTSIYQAWTQ